VRKKAEFEAFIAEGEAAIERGDFYTQEEMEAWAATLNAERKKAA
jgi:predicted transcriptional regulator